MKNKHLIMAALSASMLLAGCNGGGNNNNSTVSSETSSETSSEIASSEDNTAARKAALASFIKNIGPNNVTMKLTASSGSESADYTYYYMGADAFMVSDGKETQGILANKEQGFFLFTVDDGEVNLHGCQGLGNDITAYYTTPSGVFSDNNFYKYIDLEGDDFVFELNTKQMIKDLTSYMSKGPGSTCLYFLLNLVGSQGSYYKYVSSASLTLAEDGSTADMSVRLASGKTVVTYTAHFSDFGTTDVKAVSDYLASAKDIPTPTGWDEDCTKSINSVFGDKASDIVFPSGLITAAFDQQALVYSNKSEDEDSESTSEETAVTYAGVQWSFFGKDLTESYGKMLKDAGYTYVGSQESSSDGYTHFYYQKEFSAQTKDEGATYIQVDWYYYSSLKQFTCQIYLATDALRYNYETVALANEKIAAYNKVATYAIPTLAESEDIVGDIEIGDYTNLYADTYGYAYYFTVDITFSDEKKALAYAEAYISSLSSTKYADTEKYDWDTDGVVIYGVVSGGNYAAVLQVIEGKTSTGNYVVELVAIGY